MKILIVGLGSMGKRRIRNLLRLNFHDIIGFDPRIDHRNEAKQYGIKVFDDFSKALSQTPQVMIISTPPDLHLYYSKIAIKEKIHFFTEVNMSVRDVSKILQLLKNKKIVGLPSCTMFFNPMIIELQKLLEKEKIGKIFFIEHYSGQHLADWHPWEDYRNFYASKKNTGGAKEMVPVELAWLCLLFSDIKSVMGNVKKISKLDADIDDLYQAIIEFKKNIFCNFTIDVFSRPPIRETRIIGKNGMITCNFLSNVIIINSRNKIRKKKFTNKIFSNGYSKKIPEVMYEREMKAFFKKIEKNITYPFSFKNELQILKNLEMIEKSSYLSRQILYSK